jgi:hypothetical protein
MLITESKALWHVDPLLGNDSEISKYKTVHLHQYAIFIFCVLKCVSDKRVRPAPDAIQCMSSRLVDTNLRSGYLVPITNNAILR